MLNLNKTLSAVVLQTCHILNIEICIIAMTICINLYHSNIDTILPLYLSRTPEQRFYLHSIAFPAITRHAVSYYFYYFIKVYFQEHTIMQVTTTSPRTHSIAF